MRNRSNAAFPTQQVEFVPYEVSEDVQRYKTFLAEQTQEFKKEYDTKLAQMEDLEQTKSKLYQCFEVIIFTNSMDDEVVPQKETLSKLIKAFHERDMRMRITDLLKAVGT